MAAKTPPFLMWYDDNPKLSVTTKIEEAIAAYNDRFRVSPTLVLVNEAELTEFSGVVVRSSTTVRRNTFWVGRDEVPPATAAEPERPAPPQTPAKTPARRGRPARKGRSDSAG